MVFYQHGHLEDSRYQAPSQGPSLSARATSPEQRQSALMAPTQLDGQSSALPLFDVDAHGFVMSTLQKCCRTLHSVSKDREVWLSLLRRYCDTVIPRPFFLPKPVKLCSGDELEARVVQWWTGWEGLRSTVQTFTTDGSIPDIWGPLCHFPGDQFFLYARLDGTIFYCDPRQPSAPMHLLVPSPYSSNSHVDVCVALDLLGTQCIDGVAPLSSECSFENRLFPPVFRLAVCRDDWITSSVEIWEIRTELEGRRTIGYSASLLKSFVDDISATCCSLLGNHVAYGTQPLAHKTRIVDWTSVSDGEPVRGIDIAIGGPDYILLLPHRRILILRNYIYISDWSTWNPSDPPSSHSPIRAQWKSLEGYDQPHSFAVPFYIDNSIRLVLYGLALTGLIISTDPDLAVPASVELTQLAECRAPILTDERWFGYRKGVTKQKQRAQLLCYKWPGDSLPEASFSEVELPMGAAYTIYVDKAHPRSRVVLFINGRPCKTVFFG
ncbi:hypothetical protein CC1G_14941 [Coprinopsis cinerea okayama7|uniref:F-box domain-containing protein n=1 Tax=Coprinopsis cinerea (strain Okayama-7 / 130 / ATCC MYA-4618 / FGSC 9003) TaxID=240176 RepID=D6RP04_COPC7|nr:hypothetical protein CC1G_14941 [Coprinopsis cinerea okayama7\|eukprot:XP_002910610.1 hypothetical protein CC1G_14941 [Coprinopsis cinerea okayama7\